MNKFVKLYYCPHASGIALGIHGSNEEIERIGNVFYNHNITGGNVMFLSDEFGYIITDFKRLKKGMINICETHLAHNPRKYRRPCAISKKMVSNIHYVAKEMAVRILRSMVKEDFMHNVKDKVNGFEYAFDFQDDDHFVTGDYEKLTDRGIIRD